MRHYEVVFLVHPSQSEQVPAMIERYRGNLEKRGGASTAWRTGGGASWPIRSTRSTRPIMCS